MTSKFYGIFELKKYLSSHGLWIDKDEQKKITKKPIKRFRSILEHNKPDF